MPHTPKTLTACARGGARGLRRFQRSTRGNIAILSALILPVLLGTFGLGTEVVSWYGHQRAMQNAADSAAIAAASNAGSGYADEARAVAARYGFTPENGATVTAIDQQPCPDGTSLCYRVTVAKPMPLVLSQFVGFRGDATLAGAPAKLVVARALAIQGLAPREYCMVALASSGNPNALKVNGGPKADLKGCSIMSNTGANCNGHDLGAEHGDAHLVSDDCGKAQTSGVQVYQDQYKELADKIPDTGCPNSPPAKTISGGQYSWSGNEIKCGDQKLLGDVTIDTDENGAVLVIGNGNLDLNGYKLQTSDGSGLTIVFTGTNGGGGHAPIDSHNPSKDGQLDIAAPTKGDWSGIAMYQDPKLTQGVDISAAGNHPSWNITGIVYLPHADVVFSGAVGKATSGKSCFVLMADTILINGTGNILARGQCDEAGVTMPTNPVPSRGKLVS